MTVQRGTNNERLSEFNVAVVIDAIRKRREGISRVEIAELTGLSPQGITKVVRKVLDSGVARESGTLAHGRGKPRTVLTLEQSSRFAIGVHIDPASISLVVLDLLGEIRDHERLALKDTPAPADAVRSIATAIETLIARTGIPRERILGVGIASPGPIDEIAGTVVGPAQLRGWEEVPIRALLHEATGLPTLLDKDVTASAVAELWSGRHADHDSFGLIYLGTGVGLGLVMDDGVVRGSFYNAGEIGHLYSGQDTFVDTCGRNGCLGTLVEPVHIVNRAISVGILPAQQSVLDHARVEQLFETFAQMARGQEPRSTALVKDVAAGLGRAIIDIANLLDLDRFVIGGPFWPSIAAPVLQALDSHVSGELVANRIHQVEVVGSSLGTDIGAIGAGCLILDRIFSPRRESLVLDGASQ